MDLGDGPRERSQGTISWSLDSVPGAHQNIFSPKKKNPTQLQGGTTYGSSFIVSFILILSILSSLWNDNPKTSYAGIHTPCTPDHPKISQYCFPYVSAIYRTVSSTISEILSPVSEKQDSVHNSVL